MSSASQASQDAFLHSDPKGRYTQTSRELKTAELLEWLRPKHEFQHQSAAVGRGCGLGRGGFNSGHFKKAWVQFNITATVWAKSESLWLASLNTIQFIFIETGEPQSTENLTSTPRSFPNVGCFSEPLHFEAPSAPLKHSVFLHKSPS